MERCPTKSTSSTLNKPYRSVGTSRKLSTITCKVSSNQPRRRSDRPLTVLERLMCPARNQSQGRRGRLMDVAVNRPSCRIADSRLTKRRKKRRRRRRRLPSKSLSWVSQSISISAPPPFSRIHLSSATSAPTGIKIILPQNMSGIRR